MVVKILITGASGLLGHALVQQATAKGYDVCSLYHEHKPQSGRTIRIDLTDARSVNECVQRERPTLVVNTASITDVDLCEREPELAARVNGTAAGLLAETCDKMKASGVVHVTNSGACSWYAFASKAVQYTGLKASIQPVISSTYPSKAKRPANSALNTSLLTKLLGDHLRRWEEVFQAYLGEKDHIPKSQLPSSSLVNGDST